MSVDADTLRRAKAGDAAAWRAVIDAHADAVLARAGSEAGAEATFLAVLAALPRYGLDADKLAAWVLTIAAKQRAVAGDAPAPARLPDGFADRVIDLHRRRLPAADALPAPRAARSPIILAIVAVACVAALAIAQLRRGGPAPAPGSATGGVTAHEPTTLVLGARGRASTGSEAEVRWELGERPTIKQGSGTVRYELGPGPPITLLTPHGAIAVAAGALTVNVMAAASTVAVERGTVMHGDRAVAPGTIYTLTLAER